MTRCSPENIRGYAHVVEVEPAPLANIRMADTAEVRMSEPGEAVENGILAAEVPSPYRLQQLLEDAVVADLRGPANGPEEELDESHVGGRYLRGAPE